MERVYGYRVFYRPVAEHLVGDTPDERPVDKLPQVFAGWFPDEPAREAALAKLVADYESPRQGYRVERVVREAVCAHCEGRGDVLRKPKGWRKKTAPPWYLCVRVGCSVCDGRQMLESQTVDLFGEAVHG